MKTLLIAAALGASMLTTAAVAATPQTPVTKTQQPVKKALPEAHHATKEHHATKGIRTHSAVHATKAKVENPAAKPEATKERKKAEDKK